MDMRPLIVSLLLLALVGCGSSPGRPSAGYSYGEPERLDAPVEPSCPTSADVGGNTPWVPHAPTTDTTGRLVPDADPVDALVCRYTAEGALEGSVELESGLERIRYDLLVPEKQDGQERVCTLIGGTPVPHLMRLSYADGELWLAATVDPNSCTDSGNGQFVTPAYLGGRLATAYDSGSWPAPAGPKGCSGGGTGRAGQEDVLVPAGWTSLLVCADSDTPRQLSAEDAARVAELLGQLDTAPGTNSCSGNATTSYNLLFRYAQGPPVAIWYSPGCEPPLHGGSLDATPSAEQTAELKALLSPA